MCGIAGIVGEGISEKERDPLQRMIDRLAHRGPDAEGLWLEDGAALGHRRLSIIDLSVEANQPFSDPTGRYQLVFNGEVYNFQEVRESLPEYPFSTRSDTEVVLAAYIQWGADCLQRFKGMFALAIWDRQDQRLFLARDRLGIKPLYYFQSGHRLLFASEIRSLLASGMIEAQADPESLTDYLQYQTVHAPYTMLKGVCQLLPGEYAWFCRGELQIRSFWDLYAPRTWTEDSPERVRKRLLDLLTQAVERRLISDVPLAAFLSGGIDSSAVVALMAEVSTQPVHTFTVGFVEPDYDESPYAELVARQYNTRHTQVRLRPEKLLDELPGILAAIDSPTVDGPNSYLVSEATRKAGFTVALSGLGGDEIFAGYPLFRWGSRLDRHRWFWQLPAPVRRFLAGATRIHGSRQAEKLSALLTASSGELRDLYPQFRKLFSSRELRRLAPGGRADQDRVAEVLQTRMQSLAGLPLLSRLSVAELGSYTQNVLLRDTDQMSMAHGLEVRVPFLDHELVDYTLAVPDSLKYPHSPKQLLVEALGARLPRAIVDRPKMGFTFPWEQWMRGELRSFCASQITHLARREWFDEQAVQELWRRFLAGDRRVIWSQIWSLVVLEDWLSRHLS